MPNTSVVDRVNEQSQWYGAHANLSRAIYLGFKTTQIILAAAIPIIAIWNGGELQRWINAIIGALIGVMEGILQMGQHHQNWLRYRATREALRREAFLYDSQAGPYASAANRDTLLAERADVIISGENAKWLSSNDQPAGKGVGA